MSTREEQKARIERLTREYREAKAEADRLLAKERDPRTQRIEGFPAMVKAEVAGSRLLAAIRAGHDERNRAEAKRVPAPQPAYAFAPPPLWDALSDEGRRKLAEQVKQDVIRALPSRSEPNYRERVLGQFPFDPLPQMPPQPPLREVLSEAGLDKLAGELTRSMGLPPKLVVGDPKPPAEPEKPGARWCRLIGAQADLLAADRRLSESKDPSRAAEMFKRLEEASTALMKARFAVEASGDGWRRSVYVSDSEEIRLPMDVTRNQLAALVRELIREGVLAMPELIP